jgi:formate--tetrahydrofolate ligase
MTDLHIAKKVKLKHINEIAEKFGINPDLIEMYGKDKAKIPLSFINRTKAKKSNLILVSAISPTPSGEEKTTMSIELSEALNRLNKKQPLS